MDDISTLESLRSGWGVLSIVAAREPERGAHGDAGVNERTLARMGV